MKLNNVSTTLVGLVVLAFAAMLAPASSAQNNSPHTGQSVRIVKRLKLTGQVGGGQQTTLFKPAATGLYRVAAYAVTTTGDPNTSSSIDQILYWFDGTANQSTEPGSLCLFSAACWDSFSTVIHAQAGQPVSYMLHLSGNPTQAVYSWFVTVEKL